MKKVLISSYEGGQVFVDAPRNASKEDIYQAVRGYIQEKTGKPITSLSNYTYETESEWQKRKLASEEGGEGFLWDDIPVITIETRTQMIEALKEIGSVTLDSKKLQDVMPEVYFYLEEKFEGFAADPSNTATEEELEAFQNGEYLVEILFKEDEVVYFVGADAQQLSNDPRWAEDDYNDIETETLAALLAAK